MNSHQTEILQESQILELVKNKLVAKSSHAYQSHSDYESYLRVMTEPMFLEELEKEAGWTNLLNGIKSRIPNDKYQKTIKFFEYPLEVTSLANEITGHLNVVWNGRNSNFNIEYPTEASKQGAEALLSHLNIRRFIENTGKKVFRSQPQTVVVIDKDSSGVPYLLELCSSRIYHLEQKPDSDSGIKSIIFSHSMENGMEKIAYYDSNYYVVLNKSKEGNLSIDSINPHNLEYCPARFFVDVPLNSKEKKRKWNPFASSLGKMSIFQQFVAYCIYAEYYGVFPVIEQAVNPCEDEDCVNGIIKTPLKGGGFGESKCGYCNSNSIFSGAGTVVKVFPSDSKDENDTRGYFKFISPDTKNLEYEDKKQKDRENDIKLNVTGYNDNLTKGAVNVQQVRSVMEDRKKPLQIMSGIASRLHEWITKTTVKLFLDADIEVSANYGTEWFLLSEQEIQMLFATAKKEGLPDSEIDKIYKLLVETKYKGQPKLIERMMIENALNPLPYKTIADCKDLLSIGAITIQNLTIKANITALISRFERENGSILEFGSQSNMTFESKIELINNTFLTYIKDEQKTA